MPKKEQKIIIKSRKLERMELQLSDYTPTKSMDTQLYGQHRNGVFIQISTVVDKALPRASMHLKVNRNAHANVRWRVMGMRRCHPSCRIPLRTLVRGGHRRADAVPPTLLARQTYAHPRASSAHTTPQVFSALQRESSVSSRVVRTKYRFESSPMEQILLVQSMLSSGP
ncbi:hypothetical protein B0H19DRAFT_1068092 [Mycena capillaripes]|nr:hypothetical protein B0H19DRAFT_1068092 [Mycena capillaripes]